MKRHFSLEIEQGLRRAALHSGSELLADGILFSPAMVAISLFILEQAQRNGIDNIFFFTREGVIIQKVFEKVSEIQRAASQSQPKDTLLHLSRLATFLPTLTAFTPEELMRVWSQYPDMSLAALFQTIGFYTDDLMQIVEQHDLNLSTAVNSPRTRLQVNKLFSDPNFLVPIEREILQRRSLLTKYLVQRGVQTSQQCLVVDLGWRGTIQDNIARLFPNERFHGVYLGLLPELNARPPNVTKIGLLSDSQQFDIEAYIEPLEFVCNADFGSVIGYDLNKKTGNVEPRHSSIDAESKVVAEAVKTFQNGVLIGVPIVMDGLRSAHLDFHDLCSLAMLAMIRLKSRPSPSLARAWFSSKQSDLFGLGRIKLREGRSVRRWYDSIVPLTRTKVKRRFSRSNWPECALALFDADRS